MLLDVTINLRPLLLSITTVRAIETWLLAALVLQMTVQRSVIVVHLPAIETSELSTSLRYFRCAAQSSLRWNEMSSAIVPSNVLDS